MKLLLKILLVLTLSWLLDGLVPAPGADPSPVVARASLESAHGAYCLPGSGPAVFLGRDLPEGTTYARFESWCRTRGGQPGWKE